ncbi:hypothetical protein [Roseateles sp.]|uniref:hypothetical protein n=1 Tax=Roseateles sp. TaxID=1971397 RepID=UPI002F3EB28F
MGIYSQGGQEFVYARLFPLLPNRTPPPPELFAQFSGRTNLFYYDWEITSNRVANARQLYQLGSIFNLRTPPSIETPSQKWLGAIVSLLGDAVTEITQTSPQELTLIRKSRLGFSGFELATLSMWLESPAFPHHIARPPVVRVEDLKRNKAAAPAPVRK